MAGAITFFPGDEVTYNGITYTVDSFSVGAYATFMSIGRDYTSPDGFPRGECIDIADHTKVTLVRRFTEMTMF